jgi:hypothetical protein
MRVTLQTSIRIRADVWAALRKLATDRALELGGRADASRVVEDLVLAEVARREERDARRV